MCTKLFFKHYYTTFAGYTTAVLTVDSKGGSKLAGLPAWITAGKTENTTATSGEYTLTLNPGAAGYPTTGFPVEKTFEVRNYSDATKKVTVTLKLTQSGVSAVSATAENDAVWTAGTGIGTLLTTNTAGKLTFTITASTTPTAVLTGIDGKAWVQASSVTGDSGTYSCAVTFASDYTGETPDATLTISTASGLLKKVITIKAVSSAP